MIFENHLTKKQGIETKLRNSQKINHKTIVETNYFTLQTAETNESAIQENRPVAIQKESPAAHVKLNKHVSNLINSDLNKNDTSKIKINDNLAKIKK